MFSADAFLQKALDKRKAEDALRSLSSKQQLVDFCSNDYLGFARSEELKSRIVNFETKEETVFGSTGSRLLKGNSVFVEALESEIAAFHHAPAGLIFNSGYDANLGLFSALLQKGDTLLYDELIHASVHDGMRLGKAMCFPFKHNDVEHLEKRLAGVSGTCYVVVESVYSMDGDFAPLKEIASLCKRYRANLMVDEAHATGVFGDKGKGRVVELGLTDLVFARVHTFGKALGCHGAIVLGSQVLRMYLINFSRSFIYTTALPVASLISVKCAYDMLSYCNHNNLITSILIDLYKSLIKEIKPLTQIESNSPIQCIIVPGNGYAKSISGGLEKEGFDVRPILSPTVKKGTERLRICLHAYNTETEVRNLVKAIKKNL
jgi:8-amino-7-oxononanoate synthase